MDELEQMLRDARRAVARIDLHGPGLSDAIDAVADLDPPGRGLSDVTVTGWTMPVEVVCRTCGAAQRIEDAPVFDLVSLTVDCPTHGPLDMASGTAAPVHLSVSDGVRVWRIRARPHRAI